MTTLHHLKREWDYHKGKHQCGYRRDSIGKCPALYPSYTDFLAARGQTEFPVEFQTYGISGQDSGIDPVIQYHFDNCDDESIVFLPKEDTLWCKECHGYFTERPERATEPVSGPNSSEVDPSANGINQETQALLREMLNIMRRVDNSLNTLVVYAEKTPVVVAVDPSKSYQFNQAGMSGAVSLAKEAGR